MENTIKCLKVTEDNQVSTYKVSGVEDLQKAVGGCVEYIALPYCNMVVNDEYIYRCEHINNIATLVCSILLGYPKIIKGNAVLVGPLDDSGRTTGITDEIKDLLFDHFQVMKVRYIG
jgi:hypothetical protein